MSMINMVSSRTSKSPYFGLGKKVRTFSLEQNKHFQHCPIFESKERAPCDVHSMGWFIDKLKLAGLNLG